MQSNIPIPPVSPRDWTSHTLQFQEVIRRLEHKREVTQKVEEVALYHINDMQLLVDNFNAHEMKNPIFSHPESSFLALAAFKSKKIGLEQLGTLLMVLAEYRAKKIDSSFQFIPLFVNDQINPQAAELINVQTGYEFLRMSIDRIQTLFEKMKFLPASERGLYIHNSQLFLKGMKDNLTNTDFHVFSIGIKENQKVLPTIGLFQTYLNCQFGINAVQLNPVIYLSTDRDIAINQITKTRDLALEFWHRQPIEMADDIACEGADVSLHDMYHAAMISSNSYEIRLVNALFIEKCNALKESLMDEDDLIALDQVIRSLLDFEYSYHQLTLTNEIDCYIRFVLEVINRDSFVTNQHFPIQSSNFLELMRDELKAFVLSDFLKRDMNIYIDKSRLKKIQEAPL